MSRALFTFRSALMVFGLLAVFVLLMGVTVFPSLASAAFTHPFLGSFCEPSGVGIAPCAPSFGEPAGMAVDPSTGDLLVINLEEPGAGHFDGTLSRYHGDGTPADFSALGTNVIDGHAGGEDATPQGEILRNEGFGPAEVEVAVAPPGSAGGTAGDIYVTDALNERVDIFESTGKHIGQIEAGFSCGSRSARTGPCTLAITISACTSSRPPRPRPLLPRATFPIRKPARWRPAPSRSPRGVAKASSSLPTSKGSGQDRQRRRRRRRAEVHRLL